MITIFIIELVKKIKSNYHKGFNKYIRTVMIYLIFSVMWILGSDAFVEAISINRAMYNQLQSLKGLLFVITTSFLLLILLWQNYNALGTLKELYEKKESDLKELYDPDKNLNSLYALMTNFMIEAKLSKEEVAIEIFRYIFDKINIADKGSVFQLTNQSVHFLDVVGYDLKSLNDLKMDPSSIELFTYGLMANNKAEPVLKKKMGDERYKKYSKKNEEIHESIYIGLLDDADTKIGISLDISEKEWRLIKKSFSEEDLNQMIEVQLLASAMYRIKTMVGVKNLLQRDVVNSFIAALEYHDEYTKGHSESVAMISVEIGKELGLNSEELEELYWAGTVHDIGKIVVPKEILNKKGRLTEEEYNIVKEHPVTAERFLSRSESLKEISILVRHHHERYDGNGYPDGLVGLTIPLFSRIICVADAYHAMTSDRTYRKGLDDEDAIAELKANRSTQFCPLITDTFIYHMDKKYKHNIYKKEKT